MKKLLATATAALMAVSIFAQGTIDVSNTATTLVIDGTDNMAAANADGLRGQLYWAPESDPNNFTPIGTVFTIGVPTPGRYAGGTKTTGNATGPGQFAFFQVRAWELAYGSTYEAALAAPAMGGRPAKTGKSDIVRAMTTPAGDPPPTTLRLSDQGLQGFAVNIPEPSVVALGLIGAGALLLLRRRK
jgi:hypothetical protein